MDGKPDNISFMIKRIKVHTLDALEDPSYRWCGQQYLVDGNGDDEGGGDGDDNDDDVDLEDQSYRLTFLPWYNCFGKVT